MKKKSFRGIPAPFHAAVVFVLFVSLFGSPVSKGGNSDWGLRAIVAKIHAMLFDSSRDVKSDGGIKNGGGKYGIFGWDGSYDPPPPPAPPPPK